LSSHRPNQYCFGSNIPTILVDVGGLSPYVSGETEPARAVKLTEGTWNTLVPSFGDVWWKRARARITALGGFLVRYTDAARHLEHFLDNTGTPLEIRFKAMNHESGPAIKDMALLHRFGAAKEFEMNGRHFIQVEWSKGDRVNSGAKVVGL